MITDSASESRLPMSATVVNVKSWSSSVHDVWVLRRCRLGTVIGGMVLASDVGPMGDFGLNVPLVEVTFVDETSEEVTFASGVVVRAVVSGAWVGLAVAEARVAAAGLMPLSPPGRQSDPRPCGAWPFRRRRGSRTRCRRTRETSGCGFGLAEARRSSPRHSSQRSPGGGRVSRCESVDPRESCKAGVALGCACACCCLNWLR